jgi:hypothetical protein
MGAMRRGFRAASARRLVHPGEIFGSWMRIPSGHRALGEFVHDHSCLGAQYKEFWRFSPVRQTA